MASDYYSLREKIWRVYTWAAAKFSASSFLLVAGKNTMLSIVWISSSWTTHFISKAVNKRCSWTSVEHRGETSIRTHTSKHQQSLFKKSDRLTYWGPAPGAVLTHAWGWAVLTLPTALQGNPISTADGMLVVRAGLNIHWLLGNAVLRAKWAELLHVYTQYRCINDVQEMKRKEVFPSSKILQKILK